MERVLLIRSHSLSPSFKEFMKGLSFFSNNTAVSVWFLLSALHVISSRIICTGEECTDTLKPMGLISRAASRYISLHRLIPEASPGPSSRPRRRTGHGHVLSMPGPIESIYVKLLPSGSRSLCSPGCPLQRPALLDDAFKKMQNWFKLKSCTRPFKSLGSLLIWTPL